MSSTSTLHEPRHRGGIPCRMGVQERRVHAAGHEALGCGRRASAMPRCRPPAGSPTSGGTRARSPGRPGREQRGVGERDGVPVAQREPVGAWPHRPGAPRTSARRRATRTGTAARRTRRAPAPRTPPARAPPRAAARSPRARRRAPRESRRAARAPPVPGGQGGVPQRVDGHRLGPRRGQQLDVLGVAERERRPTEHRHHRPGESGIAPGGPASRRGECRVTGPRGTTPARPAAARPAPPRRRGRRARRPARPSRRPRRSPRHRARRP